MRFREISQFEDIAHHYINASCKEICKLIDLHDFELAFVKLDWSKRRSCSRGGWYPRQGGAGVSIGMEICTKNNTKDDVFRVYEYKSFDADPVIGGFYTRNVEDKIALHCLHEVAHAAQYWGSYLKDIEPGSAHGDRWKSIYAHLRKNILNPRLPDQKELRQEYEDYIDEIAQSPLQAKFLRAASAIRVRR